MKSVKKTYEKHLQQGLIEPDPEQAKLVDKLQAISEALQQKRFFWRARSPVKGLYLWGKVGRGKTYLMDLFYESLPFKDKHRSHFHRFMHDVHEKLKVYQGKSNPLKLVAKDFAKQARVFCFDEFVVEDISDAMILNNFFKTLLDEGVTLMATSNSAPHQLYWSGLQRQQFLPCIKLIEAKCEVFHLTHHKDYRRSGKLSNEVYFYPINKESDERMLQCYKNFVHGLPDKQLITVDGRDIKTLGYHDKTIWFNFKNICSVPRSKRDYLELCSQFDCFLVSHVKQFKATQADLARNFINFIDVLYDARKRLIISANVPYNELYPDGRFAFEFKRIYSRLHEMQSLAYLQQYNQI